MAFRSLHLIAVCMALAMAGSARPAAQSRERAAFVTLVDRETGLPRPEVSPRDLVIREDGATREILRVVPADGPLPIAVLVDTSAGAENTIADVRTGMTAFLDALGGVGPVAIVAFGERPTVLTPYTSSRPALTAGIGRIFARPGSFATLLEAIDETARGLAKREGERAALVVVSTNGAEQIGGAYTRTLSSLQASGAALHVINLSLPGRTRFDDATRQRDMLIDRGVSLTGGTRTDVLATMAWPQAMAGVARVLAHQVKVVYARPQTLIPPETFTVTAASPGHIAYGAMAKGSPQ